MRQKSLTRLILALCLTAVMIAILLGVGVWMFVSVQPDKPAATPVPATNAELTTRDDLLPDRSKLYHVYEGTLTDADGKAVTLAELRGQPTVLLFWSSWCGDCKGYFAGMFPQAVEAAEAAGARLVLVARENVRGETRQTAEACLEGYGFTCGTLMDPDAALFETLGLRSVPSMAFFAADGTLTHATADMPSGAETAAMLAYANGGALQQTEQLLAALTKEGGVASSCMIENGALLPRGTVLSETQGLMMHYALAANNKALFDNSLAYARNHMTRSGLCAWQTVNGEMASVNASLDDLRLVEALLFAEEKWGGYTQELAYRERALYAKCIEGGWMRDYVGLNNDQVASEVTLCYQDAAAMRALAGYREGWTAVADQAEQLLAQGVISDEFPLYWPRYDVNKASYTGNLLQMNEAMVTVLHAAKAGIPQEKTLDWLQARLQEGYIAAGYTPEGRVASGYEFESTATYALLVQIGIAAGRPEMALCAMQEMERLRAFEAPVVGGYGASDGTLLYTFDVVQALLAWQQWQSYIMK